MLSPLAGKRRYEAREEEDTPQKYRRPYPVYFLVFQKFDWKKPTACMY